MGEGRKEREEGKGRGERRGVIGEKGEGKGERGKAP